MARLEASLKKIVICCDLNPVHYSWSPEELETLNDCKQMSSVIKKRLESNNYKIKKMYAIFHNSEKAGQFWASKRHETEPEFKEYQETVRANKHVHIVIIFDDDFKIERSIAAKLIGLSFYAIDKIHTEDGCMAYLCHSKYPKKYQYSKTDVITLAGENYSDYYDQHIDKWKCKEVLNKTKKSERELFKEIQTKYINGELSYEEIFAKDEYYEVVINPYYKKNLDKIKDNIEDVYKHNYHNLCQIICENNLVKIDMNSVGKILYKSYIYQKNSLDREMLSNFMDKIKEGTITINQIQSNTEYYEYYLQNQASLENALLSQMLKLIETKHITCLEDIRQNKILSYIYDTKNNPNEKPNSFGIIDRLLTPPHTY